MWQTLLTDAVIIGLLTGTIRVSCPILMAALGEVCAERTGVLDIGLEGQMLSGALAGFLACYFTGSHWFGMLAGVLAGGVMALLLAFVVISLHANQVVAGVATSILAVGLTTFIYQALFGASIIIPRVQIIPNVHVPWLSDIPYLGPILFQQKPYVYVALLLMPVAYLFLYKTTIGLQIRATGEHPGAADTMGVNVYATRYLCLVFAGLASGFGGAMLTLGHSPFFLPNISGGRAWIGIAIVVVGGWNPLKVLAASLVFGLADALQLALQSAGIPIPSQLPLMIPYIVTVITMAVASARAHCPEALGIPYLKE